MDSAKSVTLPSKRTLQVTGVILFLIGAAAVLVPAVASVTITLLVGWLLGFAGVMAVVSAVMHPGDHRALRALWGLVALGLGAYFVIFAPEGTKTLTLVLGINFLAMGAIRVGAWMALRGTAGAAAMGFNGAVSIVLGVIILFDYPESAAWAIGLLVGIELMFFGIALISGGRTVDHTAPTGARTV